MAIAIRTDSGGRDCLAGARMIPPICVWEDREKHQPQHRAVLGTRLDGAAADPAYARRNCYFRLRGMR
jgi:hypothetical protein